jgi:hypothetical protein
MEKMRPRLKKGTKETAMKGYVKTGAIVLLVFWCSFSACSSTRLTGVVYTSDKQPARDTKILVRAEPGNQATWVREDGSFELKGLEPEHVYTIIAVSEADNTEARVQRVHIEEGQNILAQNQMLILAVPITTSPSQDTSSIKNQGKGAVVPETP